MLCDESSSCCKGLFKKLYTSQWGCEREHRQGGVTAAGAASEVPLLLRTYPELRYP